MMNNNFILLLTAKFHHHPSHSKCYFFSLQNLPFYRIFVADSRSPRDGKHLEQVGHYDPIPAKDGNKHLGLNIERIQYWLGVGAQPSPTVARLLGQAGVIPTPPPRTHKGRFKNPDKYKSK